MLELEGCEPDGEALILATGDAKNERSVGPGFRADVQRTALIRLDHANLDEVLLAVSELHLSGSVRLV